ncbi:glycosyltransferase family 4 protein [Mycetocola zhadangensis]|uniref:D-inositol 3-phosphate glycosyltransferase n=1 Tax=Mycetocola zhadangensis TaxID=1164595 RepID=A0A3L7J7K5_9MICO|nr:glycosyltransferase family 4 protein [Mycetocola zhadangensis]
MGADTFSPDVNGAARFAERLAAGMVGRGHEVHVVAPAASRKRGTWTETHEGQEMTVHRLTSWRWYPHDWLRFALPWTVNRNAARIIDAVQPDVIHSQSYLIVGRGLTNEGSKRGIRIISTNHLMPENALEFTLLPERFREGLVRWAWKLARGNLSLAEAVTTPTRRAADFLEKYTGLTDVHAISCGIDAHMYTPSFEPRTENRILFVGRVTGEKQIDVLIKAFATLDPSLDAKLEIVGGGDQKRNLETLAEQLGLGDRVTFTGYVSDEELRSTYTRATVLAMPSIAELQSIVTMEAMASALPVVAANAMALPHLVHDDANGYLFEPGNVSELADRLTDVLTASDDKLTAMKRESLRMIKAHDIQRTLSTFESMYRGQAVTDPVTEAIPIQVSDE